MTNCPSESNEAEGKPGEEKVRETENAREWIDFRTCARLEAFILMKIVGITDRRLFVRQMDFPLVDFQTACKSTIIAEWD